MTDLNAQLKAQADGIIARLLGQMVHAPDLLSALVGKVTLPAHFPAVLVSPHEGGWAWESCVAEVRLAISQLEKNLTAELLVEMISNQASHDLLDLFVYGDEAHPDDAFLRTLNGLRLGAWPEAFVLSDQLQVTVTSEKADELRVSCTFYVRRVEQVA